MIGRIALIAKSWRKCQEEETFTTHCEVLNYLLEPYASDDVIADTEAEIMRFSQPLNETQTEHAELLWAEALRGDRVYNE